MTGIDRWAVAASGCDASDAINKFDEIAPYHGLRPRAESYAER
jgi:hypothetical protein